MNVLQRLDHRYSRWLTRPAKNAAGRMGLYRIIYSLFYLWFISHLRFGELGLIPPEQWKPTILFRGLSPLPSFGYSILEVALVMALVLLLLGYKSRYANLVVLIAGFSLAIFRRGLLLKEHTILLTVFYVPLFMLMSQWGTTYSIDALLRQKRGQPLTDPKDSSWRYIWPARGLMVVLSILFLSSAFEKVRNLDWLLEPRLVSNFLLAKGVSSFLRNGLPVHPLGPWLGQTDALIIPTQYIVLLFEAVFFLVLFSRLAQAIILRLAPMFHSFNALLLGIPFTSILSVYAAFPDWQTLYEQFYPKCLRLSGLTHLPTPWLRGGTIGLALLVGLLWNTTPIPRQVFGLFDLFNYQTFWFALLPFIVLGMTSPLWLRFRNGPRRWSHRL